MTGGSQRLRHSIMTSLALALAIPALAQAQSTKPAASTGAVADLAAQSATLLGRVDPNGARTTYHFQYGPTTRYGAATPPGVATASAGTINVTGPLTGLAPATTYHYRLVATNRNGTTRGADRTFKTRRQPLGLTLAATPNPVKLERPVLLAGTLTGTGNANRRILLQSSPFPHTLGFQPTANVQLTNAAGQFAFPLLAVALNTQYRVLIPGRPEIASPIVSLGVAPRIATYTSATRVRTNRRVRFFGTVRPAQPGARFAIQVLRRGAWRTVAGGVTRGSRSGVSRYAKTVRIRRGGRYRVYVAVASGSHVPSAGRTVRISRIF